MSKAGSFPRASLPGTNRILEELDRLGVVSTVPRVGDAGEDLGRLFASWIGASRGLEAVRGALPATNAPGVSIGKEPSPHFIRFWAAEQAARLCVTVVLENQRQ